MKRFLVILFSAAYILTATECSQLFRLPVLIEHYSEHKQQDRSISFFDFLYMHYAGDDFNDHDQDRDDRLPFKSQSNYPAAEQFVPANSEISLNLVSVINRDQSAYNRIGFESSYLSSVWQPPKAC